MNMHREIWRFPSSNVAIGEVGWRIEKESLLRFVPESGW
jgi:hypothetical protein